MSAHCNHPWTMKKDFYTGTKPKTQFDNYRFLMKLRCVTMKHRLYQSLSDHHKICGSCYANTPANLKPIYAFVMPHNQVHRHSVHYQENCTACGKEVINVKPADECRGCIKEFRRADQAVLSRGWEVPVIATWVEEWKNCNKTRFAIWQTHCLQFNTQHFVSGDTQAVSLSLVAHKQVSFNLKKGGVKKFFFWKERK